MRQLLTVHILTTHHKPVSVGMQMERCDIMVRLDLGAKYSLMTCANQEFRSHSELNTDIRVMDSLKIYTFEALKGF